MTQQPLFGVEPAGDKLGTRQQTVLDAVDRAGWQGVTSDEAGALVHASRGKHDEGDRCTWCSREGLDVLKTLRARGLVTRRRDGGWTRSGPRPVRDDGSGPDDLPEGF